MSTEDRHMVYIPGYGWDIRIPLPTLDDTERYRDEPDDPGPEEGWEPPQHRSNRHAGIEAEPPF